MTGRDWMLGGIAVLAAAMCVRLGFWQLDRLEQRRERNALISGQTNKGPATMAEARMQDTSQLHWRRVRFQGVADYGREVVLASRSQAGSVGVQVVTAVHPVGNEWGDTAVLVIRGWMQAADGRNHDNRFTNEGDTLLVEGLVTHFPPAGKGAVRMPSAPRAFRWLDRDTLSREMATPLAPFVLLQLGDTVQRDVTRLVRVPPPSLGDGPHKSYAFQWFAFAAVAIVGFGAFVRTNARANRTGPDQSPEPV